VLAFVLALGGTRHGDTAFYAPYTFRRTPGDGFEMLAVLGRNVLVRAEPRTASAVIDTLSFEAVARWREGRPGPLGSEGWEPVRTRKGRTGWVLARFVRSPIDYRAGFVRRQGRWWLRALVAGD
jgi:Bacterial SH3 domain